MAVKTEKDLSPNSRTNSLKSLQAIEQRNFSYAITLLQSVLKETPEFLEGRKMLRRAERELTKGKKNFFSGMSTLSLKGPSLVKKDPLAALELAEKELESDPFNGPANHLLKDAARAVNMPETAAFALETLVEGNPKDTKVLHELGLHYYDNGDPERAIEIFNKILEINPSDLIANKRGKDAAARLTMSTGGWETAKDYRDLIKDKDAAVSLEQQNRVVKSEEAIDQQIVELYARAEQEPENVDVARRIASLFEQKEEIDSAVWWYNRASELTKHTDSSLVRKVTDLQNRQLELAIRTRLEFLEAAPHHEDAPRYREEVAALRKQKAEALIGDARKRVERNPTDLQFRYELGEQLLYAGLHTEAIPELQKARNNPNARIKAMNLLGQCYIAKGMLDLALRQFTEAVKELTIMDANKKEILYRLGLLYEKMGKKEQSLDCMKEIYDVDYGYEDVATRVEESYGSATT